jgi:hypothetical protein
MVEERAALCARDRGSPVRFRHGHEPRTGICQFFACRVRRLPGSGYRTTDAQLLETAGLVSAFLSVVILAIDVNSGVTHLYTHPDRLLLMCPVLLYWLMREWLNAHRETIHDDPVVAIAADPVTYVLVAASAAIVLAAV